MQAIIVAAACLFLALPATSAQAGVAEQDGAPLCAACHGLHGEGAPNGVPRLAGQDAEYLNHALSMFKEGTRASAIMQPIARSLGEPAMRRLAEYFAKQDAPPADAAAAV